MTSSTNRLWALALLVTAGTAQARTMVTEDGVPQEISDGWDSTRQTANKFWTKLNFTDEWGVARVAYARTTQASPTCMTGKEDCDAIFAKKYPLFYFTDTSCPDGMSGVACKIAVLSAYDATPEKVGTGGSNLFLTSPGTSLKLGMSFGFDLPASEWLVSSPRKREKLQSSPMAEMGDWLRCALSPGSSYTDINKKTYKFEGVFKRLHPVEVELAHQHASYGPKFTTSADFLKAVDDDANGKPETAYAYAEKLRTAVFPDAKSKGDAGPPATPQEKFTAFEAKFLACRMSGVSSSWIEDGFRKGLDAVTDKKEFVKNWRTFIYSELKTYAAYAKDMPGAKSTATSWEGFEKGGKYAGHDYKKLLEDLKNRTDTAVTNGGKPAATTPPPVTVITPKVQKKVGNKIDDIINH